MFNTYSYFFELPKEIREEMKQELIENWGDVPPTEISRRMGFVENCRVGDLMGELDVPYWLDRANGREPTD